MRGVHHDKAWRNRRPAVRATGDAHICCFKCFTCLRARCAETLSSCRPRSSWQQQRLRPLLPDDLVLGLHRGCRARQGRRRAGFRECMRCARSSRFGRNKQLLECPCAGRISQHPLVSLCARAMQFNTGHGQTVAARNAVQHINVGCMAINIAELHHQVRGGSSTVQALADHRERHGLAQACQRQAGPSARQTRGAACIWVTFPARMSLMTTLQAYANSAHLSIHSQQLPPDSLLWNTTYRIRRSRPPF